jgi:PAS domain S-box-containing protein
MDRYPSDERGPGGADGGTDAAALHPLLVRPLLSIQGSPAPTALFDANRRFVGATQRWEEVTGLAGKAYIGRLVEEALPALDDEFIALHRRAAEGEHLASEEEPHVDARGETRWLSCVYRPFGEIDGRIVGYFVHGADITPLMTARADAQANAERLRLALGAARAGVSELDFVRKSMWTSAEFEEIVGMEVDFGRFAREPWYMAHPEDKPAIRRVIADWTGLRHEPMDFRVLLPDGEIRWVQIHGEQQVNEQGRRTKIVGLILDVDARKRQEIALTETRRVAQANADRLGLALKAARAGVFETSFTHRSFWCSPEFTEIAGRALTFDEAARPEAWPIIHAEDKDGFSAAVQAWSGAFGSSSLEHEARIVLPSGSTRWVRINCQMELTGAGLPDKLTGLILDIDVRKQQELALIEAERAAQAAAEAKSQFLANMSHEIRTPMNGVLGVLHLLKQENLSEEGVQLLQEASNCGRMLSQLLDDVIDFSKIEAGRLELSPEPLDAAQLLDSVVGLLKTSAAGKGVELRVKVAGASPWIQADPVRLRQALFNLIGNAVKFTPKGHVEARLEVKTEGDRRRLRFEIEDTGIGIAAAVQSTLFNRFQQADGSTSRKFGGSGLGLSITRRLAELMDGHVGFISTEGQGSTFWIEICAPAAQTAPESASAEAPDLQGVRILLVEDNPTNRLVAAKILETMGVHVATAEHGGEGVDAVRKDPYDLILMDVQMPVMDGLEATRCIRALGGRAGRTPIVGLTANAMAHQREAYLAAGMNGVAAKPISPGALFSEIGRVLAETPRAAA